MGPADPADAYQAWATASQELIEPKDLVTWLIALIGIAATGVGIVHQVRKGLANALNVQRENTKQDYQLKIYKDFSEHVTAWQDSRHRLGSLLHQATRVFSSYFDENIKTDVKQSIVPSWRMDDFERLFRESQRNWDRIGSWIRSNDIVSPHFKVFGMAILSASFDENKAFVDLHPILVRRLPTDVTDGVVFNPPSIREYETLKNVISAYLRVLSVEHSYVTDLQTHVQNVLLSAIFDNTADVRFVVEGVPHIRIETDDQHQVWEAYFLREIVAKSGSSDDRDVR